MVLAATFIPVIGCQGLQNCCNVSGYWDAKVARDKQAWAAKNAWNSRFQCYENEAHIQDFARGFKAGYLEVAGGGSGCTPAFPAREYWGYKHQNCEGQAKVAAWFAGYPHGVRAAEEDGVGNFYQLQTSSGIQNQYAQYGMMDPAYAGMYPVPQQAVSNRGKKKDELRPVDDEELNLSSSESKEKKANARMANDNDDDVETTKSPSDSKSSDSKSPVESKSASELLKLMPSPKAN
jgi:hypothetical protein